MTLDLRGRAESRPDTKTTSFKLRIGLVGRLLAALGSIRANRQLKRAAQRYRSRGSPPIPPYLRYDLGLPPEAESPSHWDHQ